MCSSVLRDYISILSNKESSFFEKYKVLKKLSKLQLDFNELKNSGIGKVVNQLKATATDSKIHTRADKLILQWKQIVNAHHSKTELAQTSTKSDIKNASRVSIPSSTGLSFEDALSAASTTDCNTVHNKKKRQKQMLESKEICPSKKSALLNASSKALDDYFVIPTPKNGKLNTKELEELSHKAFKLEPLECTLETAFQKEYHPSNNLSFPLNKKTSHCDHQNESSTNVKDLCLPEKSKFRSKVFAGRSSNFGSMNNAIVVPKLVTLCLNFLSENINNIREFGPMVPFHLICPVLQKCNPEQLRRLERWNPHLIEETQAIWRQHFIHDFRRIAENYDEKEDWRALYKSLLAQQQSKLELLSQRINHTKEIDKPKQRTTKLAFINESAKPPSSVRRQQARYGTAVSNETLQHPYRKLTSQQKDETVAVAPRQFVQTSAATTFALNNSHTLPKKSCKPPLMQKAMQMAKKMHRRT